MGRLQISRKILNEDLAKLPKEVREGLAPMINTLNSFMEITYEGFNRNLTFDQNISCFIQEIIYKTPPTYPVMDDVRFASKLNVKAVGVILLQALFTQTYEPVTTAVYVPWVEKNGEIIIKPILGLSADSTYTVRLLII